LLPINRQCDVNERFGLKSPIRKQDRQDHRHIPTFHG
jgi:hypothetical protein